MAMPALRALSSLPRALSQRASLGPARLAAAASFHTSRPALVAVGDRVPDLNVLVKDSPSNKVNLAGEFAGVKRGIIIGVPAAFSPACSAQHVPGYINSAKARELLKDGKIAVVSVNDSFV
jgi:peroxiredoxin 5